LKKNCTKYVQKIRRRKMTVFELIEANGLNLHGDIELFADLVAAQEREACAALCFSIWNEWLDTPEEDRYKVLYDAEDCAAAIRARGTT
jgi:hypothetical protein